MALWDQVQKYLLELVLVVSAPMTQRPSNVANFRAFFSNNVVIVGIFLKATVLGDMLLHENPTYCYFQREVSSPSG